VCLWSGYLTSLDLGTLIRIVEVTLVLTSWATVRLAQDSVCSAWIGVRETSSCASTGWEGAPWVCGRVRCWGLQLGTHQLFRSTDYLKSSPAVTQGPTL
jgi:hypothetical protein